MPGSWLEAPGRELLLKAPGGWPGQGEVRGGGSAVSILPRSPGAPLNSASLPGISQQAAPPAVDEP